MIACLCRALSFCLFCLIAHTKNQQHEVERPNSHSSTHSHAIPINFLSTKQKKRKNYVQRREEEKGKPGRRTGQQTETETIQQHPLTLAHSHTSPSSRIIGFIVWEEAGHARPIKRDPVRRAVGRFNNLQRNQHDIDQLQPAVSRHHQGGRQGVGE